MKGAPAIDSFRRRGSFVARGVFTAAELETAMTFAPEVLEAARTDAASSTRIEMGEDLHQRPYVVKLDGARGIHDPLAALARDSRLLEMAAAFLGEPALLFKDKFIFKPPSACGFPPHQDLVFGYHRLITRAVSCMVACDAADPENGCLEVRPGGHHLGFLAGPEEEPAADCIPEHEWRPVPLGVGDVLFFDGLLPHRSADNHSARPRRTFIATYGPESDGDGYESYYAWRREWVTAGYPTHFEGSAPWRSRIGLG